METTIKVPKKEAFKLSSIAEKDLKPLREIFLLDSGNEQRNGWVVKGIHRKKNTPISIERGFNTNGRWGHADYTIIIGGIKFAQGSNLKEVISNTIKLLNFKL